MILIMFLLFGLINHVSSIKCYTCDPPYNFCPLPLSLDAGEENNENDINSVLYGSNDVCLSDHYIDSQTGSEKLILSGVEKCEELDIPNHRRYCCYQDNCNKVLPKMTMLPIYSNNQRYLPSIILISFSIIFRYIF